MSKARSTGNIGNIIKTSATCVTVNDGTTDLLIMSGSGKVTIPGNLVVLGGISGSSAESSSYSLSSSFATNANLLDGIDGASFLQTGSFNTFSSSIDTTIKNKLNGDGVISGSVQVDITSTTGYSTFSSSLSSSIGSLSGSVATTTSGLSSSIGSLSSSVATTTSGLAGRIESVETKTGSYATTGSNIFVGSQVITGSICSNGNIVTTGQIVAQTINVQQVTSSIVYSCGSNIFGNILSNTQQFTGSILATGSLTIAGPMIGSSTVCGVMGTFSCVGIGTLTPANAFNVSNNGASGFEVSPIGGVSSGVLLQAYNRSTSTYMAQSYYACTHTFNVGGGGATRALDIDSTGVACFSNNVCAPSFVLSNGNCITALRSTGGATIGVLGFTSGTDTLFIKGGTSGAAASIQFQDTGGTMATFYNCKLGIGTTTPGTKLEISSTAADADRTIPHNVLTLTAEQGNAPYGFFGGAILFKNRSYTSGLFESARIRSVIYDDGAPNNFGGGIWFESTPTPGGTLTPSLKINYVGVACFSNNVCAPNLLISNCATIGTVGFSYPEFRLAVTPIMTVVGAGCASTSEGIYFKRVSNLCQGGWISGYGGALYIVGQNKHSTAFGDIYFASNNGTTTCDIMVIDGPNQRVGIGTTTPYAKFEVLGGNQCPPSTGTQNYTMALRDPTSMVCGVGGSILFQGYKTGTAAIGNFAYIAGKKENGTAGNEAGYISLGNFDSAGNVSERMRISSASCGGVVRIGTCAINWNTNSNVALQVAGAIKFGNPDGDYVPSYGGGISARTLSTFAPGSFAILVKGLGGSGFLYQVQGFTLAGVRFTDLLFGVNNTFSVIATAGEGSPAARAYTITSENLNICIGGSATYSAIIAHGFGAVER
jgi:hypothetical protein